MTAEIARGIDPHGDLYQQRAHAALPLLVRQALAGQIIYYGDLAAELEMPNARNLNFVLGAVGTSLDELGRKWGVKVPRLVALVVNRATGIPGSGFVNWIVEPQVLASMGSRTRRQVVDGMLAEVYSYRDWAKVLAHFGQKPVSLGGALLRQAAAYRGGGESDEHKALKALVAGDPRAVGLQGRVIETVQEYRLPSGDEIDVIFRTRRGTFAVEVKSEISPEADVARGVFQCVKYRALLNAVAASQGLQTDVDVVLALGGSLTPDARRLANTLGVAVVERVGIPLLG